MTHANVITAFCRVHEWVRNCQETSCEGSRRNQAGLRRLLVSIEGYCRVVERKLSVRHWQPSATGGAFHPLADDVVAPHKVPDGLGISVGKSR